VDRGDVRPGALTPACIEAGPALLRQQFIESGEQPSEEAVRLLVDNVLIPMLRVAPQAAGPAGRSARPAVRTAGGQAGPA
jgi:hypothetical protein